MFGGIQVTAQIIYKTQVKNNTSFQARSERKDNQSEKCRMSKGNDLSNTIIFTGMGEVNETVVEECFFDDWLKV